MKVSVGAGAMPCGDPRTRSGAKPIIPIRRNDILRATRRLGRSIWKKWTGYHTRSRVGSQMDRIKLLGDRIMSRNPDRQTAEIQTLKAMMNRFSALGRAEIDAVA